MLARLPLAMGHLRCRSLAEASTSMQAPLGSAAPVFSGLASFASDCSAGSGSCSVRRQGWNIDLCKRGLYYDIHVSPQSILSIIPEGVVTQPRKIMTSLRQD